MHPFEKVLDFDAFGENRMAYSAGYSASGRFTGSCHVEDRTLHFKGFALDQITETSSVCEWNLATGGLDIERSWAPTSPNDPYFNKQTLMEAYNHTLVADIGRQDMADDSMLSRGFAVDWDLVDKGVADMTPKERQKQSWMLLDVKMMTFVRRLFRTKDGYMGLGPAAAQIGDKVCVLLGGQLLYVLRDRENSRFEFVGECYVHGMMDGQACEDEGLCDEEIVLI